MILGWRISTEHKSSVMLENLCDVYSGYLLEKEDTYTVLMVDYGIKNKGLVCIAIENKDIKIRRLVAQKDIRFSNSMKEQAKVLRIAENKALSCHNYALFLENETGNEEK